MKVFALFTAPEPAVPMVRQTAVRAIPGCGLEGDRYFKETGSFSRWPGARREVSLIAVESIDAIAREFGIVMNAGEHRRSIVTQGVNLDSLIGKKFRVGEVILQGERPCLPCKHVERLVAPGLFDALKKHGGGLRAFVLEEGVIRVGDEIELNHPSLNA
jgi:MOSC domain-containing protein YiiM